MEDIRYHMQELEEQKDYWRQQTKDYKEILDKIYKVSDSFEWHYKDENTPEGYISKIISEYWLKSSMNLHNHL